MEIKNIYTFFTTDTIIFYFDSSDEEDTKEKIWGFCEETVPRFSDKQFQQSFRMSPTTFEKLAQLNKPCKHKHFRAPLLGNYELIANKNLKNVFQS